MKLGHREEASWWLVGTGTQHCLATKENIRISATQAVAAAPSAFRCPSHSRGRGCRPSL